MLPVLNTEYAKTEFYFWILLFLYFLMNCTLYDSFKISKNTHKYEKNHFTK